MVGEYCTKKASIFGENYTKNSVKAVEISVVKCYNPKDRLSWFFMGFFSTLTRRKKLWFIKLQNKKKGS